MLISYKNSNHNITPRPEPASSEHYWRYLTTSDREESYAAYFLKWRARGTLTRAMTPGEYWTHAAYVSAFEKDNDL